MNLQSASSKHRESAPRRMNYSWVRLHARGCAAAMVDRACSGLHHTRRAVVTRGSNGYHGARPGWSICAKNGVKVGLNFRALFQQGRCRFAVRAKRRFAVADMRATTFGDSYDLVWNAATD